MNYAIRCLSHCPIYHPSSHPSSLPQPSFSSFFATGFFPAAVPVAFFVAALAATVVELFAAAGGPATGLLIVVLTGALGLVVILALVGAEGFDNPFGNSLFLGCIKLAKSGSSISLVFTTATGLALGTAGASKKFSSSKSPHASGSLSSLSSSPRKLEGGLLSTAGAVKDFRRFDDGDGDVSRGDEVAGTLNLPIDGSEDDLATSPGELLDVVVLVDDSNSPTAFDRFFVNELIAQPAQLASVWGVPMRGIFVLAAAPTTTPSVACGVGMTVSG